MLTQSVLVGVIVMTVINKAKTTEYTVAIYLIHIKFKMCVSDLREFLLRVYIRNPELFNLKAPPFSIHSCASHKRGKWIEYCS